MNDNNIIEKYLDGQLDGKELEDFKSQLSSDKGLQQELNLRKEINESIEDDEVYYLRQKLDLLIPRVLNKKPLYLKVAGSIAAALLLAFLLVNINNEINPVEIYTSYYAPYDIDINTRSAENEKLGLDFAFKLYAEGEYLASYELLNNYNEQTFDNTMAIYYQSLCAMEIDKPEVAEAGFKKILEGDEYAYSLHAKWYLSMLYLKHENTEEAEVYLRDLASEKSFYSERATKLLKKHF